MSSCYAASGVGILGYWKFLRIRGRDRVGYPNILSLPELKLVIVALVSVVFWLIVVWSVLCHFLNGADCPR